MAASSPRATLAVIEHATGGDTVTKWLRRSGLAVLLLAALGVVAGAWYGLRVLPRTDGEIVLAGASAELRIERDDYGIPSVRAGSTRDAYFGLGVGYNMTPNLALTGEADFSRVKYGLEGAYETDNVRLISIGLRYSF